WSICSRCTATTSLPARRAVLRASTPAHLCETERRPRTLDGKLATVAGASQTELRHTVRSACRQALSVATGRSSDPLRARLRVAPVERSARLAEPMADGRRRPLQIARHPVPALTPP